MNRAYQWLLRLFPEVPYEQTQGKPWLLRTRVDIADDGSLYLRRFILARTPWGALYLHHIVRSDHDRCLHDHPWSFVTLMLWGGYWEETPGAVEVRWDGDPPALGQFYARPVGERRKRVWYRPGTLRRVPAHWCHRVVIPDEQPAWTLVLTTPRQRTWGFWTADGWMQWRAFLAGEREC